MIVRAWQQSKSPAIIVQYDKVEENIY